MKKVLALLLGLMGSSYAMAVCTDATQCIYHVAPADATCSHGTAPHTSGDCESLATACVTVQEGLNKLRPGKHDVVWIHTGTFTEDTELTCGGAICSSSGGMSPQLPWEIKGATGKCNVTTSTACQVDADCSNETCVAGDTLSGIILRGGTSESTVAQPADTVNDVAALRIGGHNENNPIENVRVKKITLNPGNTRGIYASGFQNVEIDGVVANTWQGTSAGTTTAAAFEGHAGSGFTLKNSSITNSGTARALASLVKTSTTTNFLIYNNDIEDAEGSCVYGSSSDKGRGNLLALNNTFKNCQGHTDEEAMFQVYNDWTHQYYGNLVVQGSTCYGGPTHIWQIRTTGGIGNDHNSSGYIVGNTVVRGACTNTSDVVSMGGSGMDFTESPAAMEFRNNVVQGWGAQAGDRILTINSLEGPSAAVPDCSGYNEAYNYIWAASLPTTKLQVASVLTGKCGNIATDAFGLGTTVTTTSANLSAGYVPNTGSPVIDVGDPDLAYPSVSGNTAKDIGVFDKSEAGTFPQAWTILHTVTGIPEFHWDDTTSTSGAIALLHPKVNPNVRHCSVTTAQTCGSAGQAGQAYGCPAGETCLPEPYFELQLDTTPSFDSQGIQIPLYTSGYIPSGGLRYWIPAFAITNGNYYVRVRFGAVAPALGANPSSVAGAWSDPFYKVTINYSPSDTTPPPAPDAISPAQGAVNVTTPILASTVVSDNGGSGPVQYNFQLFKGTSTTAPDCTSGLYQDSGWINVNSFPVASTRRDFTSCLYYGWRVRARDSAVPPNTSGWCCCVTFRATGPTCNPLYPQEPSP